MNQNLETIHIKIFSFLKFLFEENSYNGEKIKNMTNEEAWK
jgi:hypothetical protein